MMNIGHVKLLFLRGGVRVGWGEGQRQLFCLKVYTFPLTVLSTVSLKGEWQTA